MLRVKDRNGVYSGLFLIGIAVVFLWQGRSLRMGTLDEMGPGYFPNLLCALQIMLGSAVLVSAFVGGEDAPEPLRLRPLLFVLASVCFFGAAIESLGLPMSLVGTVVIAGLAQQGARYLQNLALGVLLAVVCTLIFIKGLALQMSIWPAGLVLP
jgi:putative tricarboxylic transport membrane protein